MSAGIINSGSFAKALYPGISNWFGRSYNDYKPEHTVLFESFSSKRATEEDVGISSFGLANTKTEAQGISYDDESQAWVTRYAHTVYGLGFIITREMVEDDLYDIVGQRRANALARSMQHTKEVVAANVYNRAFNASYPLADGLSMVNSAHVNWAGGTQSNTLSVQADISEASLEQACIDIQKWTDERGLLISVLPKSLHITPEQEFEVYRILKTTGRVGTNNNDVNAIASMGKFPGGVHVNHRFTDTDAWFIRTDVQNGLKHFTRRGMEFTIDNDFDTENAKYKATERYSFGCTDWRAIYGSQGA